MYGIEVEVEVEIEENILNLVCRRVVFRETKQTAKNLGGLGLREVGLRLDFDPEDAPDLRHHLVGFPRFRVTVGHFRHFLAPFAEVARM